MAFDLIYFVEGSLLKKKEENIGRLRPYWGNSAWAATARFGTIGLNKLKKTPYLSCRGGGSQCIVLHVAPSIRNPQNSLKSILK